MDKARLTGIAVAVGAALAASAGSALAAAHCIQGEHSLSGLTLDAVRSRQRGAGARCERHPDCNSDSRQMCLVHVVLPLCESRKTALAAAVPSQNRPVSPSGDVPLRMVSGE